MDQDQSERHRYTLGVTASQTGLTEAQTRSAAYLVTSKAVAELHHGDCIGGDAQLHDIASANSIRTVVHPPSNESKRAFCAADIVLPPRGYRERNRDIVDSVELLVAFPSSMFEIVRSGTWMTVRIARATKVPVIVVWPNGLAIRANTIESTAKETAHRRMSVFG